MDDRPTPGVGVAVVDDGRLLVVERGEGVLAGMWAVPGGRVEYGERMEHAAVREVLEETGIEIRLGPVIWTGDAIGPGDPPEWHFTLVDFVGFPTGGRLQAGDDARAARWVTLQEALALPLVPTMRSLLARLEPHLRA